MSDFPRSLSDETRDLLAELASYGATIDTQTLILLRVEALSEELDERGVLSYDANYDRWEALLQQVIRTALNAVEGLDDDEDDDMPLTANDLMQQWGLEDGE
jgi:predicted outer membrane protein